jgi:hypothetical protein
MIFLPCGLVLIFWGVYELKTNPSASELFSSGGCGLMAGLMFLVFGIACVIIGSGD